MSARAIADLLYERPDAICALARIGCDECGMRGRVVLAPLPVGALLHWHRCPVCRGHRAYVAALRVPLSDEEIVAFVPGGAS